MIKEMIITKPETVKEMKNEVLDWKNQEMRNF